MQLWLTCEVGTCDVSFVLGVAWWCIWVGVRCGAKRDEMSDYRGEDDIDVTEARYSFAHLRADDSCAERHCIPHG